MGWSQEIITYDRSDFDLKGPVKSCFVFTKYGQEQYQFNKTGQLVEAATNTLPSIMSSSISFETTFGASLPTTYTEPITKSD